MVALTRSTAYTPLPAARLNEYATEIERVVTGTFGDLTRTARPIFKVERTSLLSVVSGIDTVVPWQSPVADSDAMWSAGTPTAVVAKKAGVWFLLHQQRWPIHATGSRTGKIMINGTNVFANGIASSKLPSQNDGEGTTVQISALAVLGAGDIIYQNAWQSAGVNQDLIHRTHSVGGVISGFGGTYLSGVWLGPG